MWLADSAGQVLDPSAGWVQAVSTGGTAGLILVLVAVALAFIRGWVVPGSFHRSALADRDRRIEALESEVAEQKDTNREQTLFLRDQVTPLLTRNTDVLAKVLEERRWDEQRRRES